MRPRGKRIEVVGRVISDKMQKTVIVETRTHVSHAKYKKIFVRRAKFVAHDEKETASLGDLVRLRESRPLSKTKRWVVVNVMEKAKVRPEEKVAYQRRKVTDQPQASGAPKAPEAGA
ncbi:MAG TPA: 30S ribosomal protein S17 [Bdellovibrionota bacterium]|nr:30S ribosomal protein S17 [Bdellovibrionota bacterium]